MKLKLSLSLLALAALWGVLVRPWDWPRYRRLAERGILAEGWVTARGEGRRPRIYYSFKAEDRDHSAVWRPALVGPSTEALVPGETIAVFYLPEDPSVSSPLEPKVLLVVQNRAIILCLAVFLPLLAWGLSREMKRAAG